MQFWGNEMSIEALKIIAGLAADGVIDKKEESTLRQAIAEAEKDEPVGEDYIKELEDAAHNLLAILEHAGNGATVADVIDILEARSKPVAYLVQGCANGSMISHSLFHDLDSAKKTASVFAEHYPTVHTIPLYTRPQPRKPLMDEQIVAIVREASRNSAIMRNGSTSLRIARAIEAAHGIKE